MSNINQTIANASKRKIEYIIQCIDYDFGGFSVEGFSKWVEEYLNCNICISSVPFDVDDGMLIKTKDTYYALYGESDHPSTQLFTILHEISHILCGHETLCAHSADELKAMLLEFICPSDIGVIGYRGRLEDRNESEAESLAIYLFGLAQENGGTQVGKITNSKIEHYLSLIGAR